MNKILDVNSIAIGVTSRTVPGRVVSYAAHYEMFFKSFITSFLFMTVWLRNDECASWLTRSICLITCTMFLIYNLTIHLTHASCHTRYFFTHLTFLCIVSTERVGRFHIKIRQNSKYKVVQIWTGQTVTCLHTNSTGHIWITLYFHKHQNLVGLRRRRSMFSARQKLKFCCYLHELSDLKSLTESKESEY